MNETKTNLFCFWLFQIPQAYLTAIYWDWGPLGILLAVVVSEIVLTALITYYFRLGKWKITQM